MRAFDIRTVVAALVGFYGVVLLVLGFTGERDDLWAGIGMLVAAAVLLGWALLRPAEVQRRERSGD